MEIIQVIITNYLYRNLLFDNNFIFKSYGTSNKFLLTGGL